MPDDLGGRPSQWLGPTKMMRLPTAHEDELKAIAHRLEAGEQISFESKPPAADPTALVQEAIRQALQEMRPSERRAALRNFQRLQAVLKPLAQSKPPK